MEKTRTELDVVRHGLESLEFLRLAGSTPALDQQHRDLCRREIELLRTVWYARP
jgi:hypothetical protein